MTVSALVAIIGIFGCSSNLSGDRFSNSDAKEAIEAYWQTSVIQLPIGRYEVVRRRPDFSKHQLSLDELNFCRAFSDAGVVQITYEKTFGGGLLNLDDIPYLNRGVLKEVVIEATPLGLKLASQPAAFSQARLTIPGGAFEIEEILENEPLEKTPDRYRIVLGTHRAIEPPEISAAFRKLGLPSAAERKFRILFKFDPFAKNWKIITQTVQDRDKEFTNDPVTAYLSAL